MRWHEYIASARAEEGRRETPDGASTADRTPALDGPVRFSGYEAVEILRAEDITMPSYVTPTLRATLKRPDRALLEIRRTDDRPVAVVTAADRSGHGKWRIEAITRSHTGPGVPADTLVAICERVKSALRSGPLGRHSQMREPPQ